MNTVVGTILIGIAVVLIPIVAYVVVRFASFAYFRSKYNYIQSLKFLAEGKKHGHKANDSNHR